MPKESTTGSESANKFFIGIMWLSVAGALTFAFLTPVRFAIVMAAEKNESKVVACEIKTFHKKSNNQRKKLWYVFEGSSKKKNITMNEYRKLIAGRDTKQYKIYLTLKKSILNTQVIQNYEIKE